MTEPTVLDIFKIAYGRERGRGAVILYRLSDNPRILWNQDTKEVRVELMGGPAHSDRDRFPMWLGLPTWEQCYLEFVTLAVRDGIPVNRLHEELCKIREYTEHLSHDTPGATFAGDE